MALIVGLDPGFACLGYAVADVKSDKIEVMGLGVLRTERSDKKRKVLASDDNLRRCKELVRLVLPLSEGAVAFCAESMSFPRSSSVAAKMAMCWGMMATLSEIREIPILQVSPKELKRKVCGNASASKIEVGEALDKRFDRSFGQELLAKGVTRSFHEHAYDALGTIVASLDGEFLQLLRRLE